MNDVMTTDVVAQTHDELEEIHPLFARLVREFHAPLIRAEHLDEYLREAPDTVTVSLIAGDAVRFPEGLDVAVVLPELVAQFPNQCRIALIHPKDEDEVAKRFAVHSRPTLLFTRGAQYMTTLVGILDWDDYVARFGEALQSSVQRVPIAIANATPNNSCH